MDEHGKSNPTWGPFSSSEWYNENSAFAEGLPMTLPEFLTQEPDGFIHVTGHRIGLLHVIELYQEGYAPEMLREEFPTLSLALLHKLIAFYLENQAKVDEYLTHCRQEIERQAAAPRPGPDQAELRRRMAALRQARTAESA
jgi:uncharacterized protein (DUF433 family)